MDQPIYDAREVARVYQKQGRLAILLRYGLSIDDYDRVMIQACKVKCLETLKQMEEKEKRGRY
jgi:hypothetical protein